MTAFETKDSGEREEYVSGMRRDVQRGKPRWDLLLTEGLPYEDQFLHRFASLLARGAEKYGERNWQNANSVEELERFKSSGLRHVMQWACGELDEDHAAAVAFNIMAYEYVKWKLANAPEEVSTEVEDSSSGDSSEHKQLLDRLRQARSATSEWQLSGRGPGLPVSKSLFADFVRVCDSCKQVHTCERDPQREV